MSSSSSLSSVVCHHFSLDQIKDATNNFDVSNILGDGGEGTVYLGHIAIGRDDEKLSVAVKLLNPNSIEFEKEIKVVSKIQHPNLVSLLGYCNELGQKILVYEYMQNGSLSDYVKKKISICLSWKQRLNICLGVARGLQYLHTATVELPKGIIHRDMKPANILLDQNWVAKVSDFGMFKLSHADQTNSTMITDLKGTRGYFAPECFRNYEITRKTDVYAFGVVMFEVLCRKKPWERGDDQGYYVGEDDDFGFWAMENADTEINKVISDDSLEIFADIVGRSLQTKPGMRPTMDEVVLDLERALKCQVRDEHEGIHPKSLSERRASIPSSVQKLIENIKEITGNTDDDEIYAMLKESSMDSVQTIRKLLIQARKGNNDATTELVESSKTTVSAVDTRMLQERPSRSAGGGYLGSFDFLRNSQQFLELRSMVQANPQLLHRHMLEELGKQNPQLLRLIQENHEDSEGDLFDQPDQDSIEESYTTTKKGIYNVFSTTFLKKRC